MGKFFIFVLFLLVSCFNFSAFAITKCIDTSVFSSCIFSNGSGSNFYSTCGSISVRGVAFCGTGNGGNSVGEVQTSSSSGDNTNCWCRMIDPAVSLWVYAVGYANEASCLSSCASRCAQYFQNNSNSLRTYMLQNLS